MTNTITTRALGRGKQRGVATVEAALSLGFLILLFWSVVYMGNLQFARQRARLRARECAWSIAASACASVPAGCSERQLASRARGARGAAIERELGAPDDSISRAAQGSVASEVSGVASRRVEARASEPLERPALFGGELVEVRATYSLPCNTHPESASGMARRLWDEAL